MANPEHLDFLKQCIGPGYPIEKWNQWRREQPGVQPDLSGARLDGAYLAGVDLTRANLSGAELVEASISRGSVICNAVEANFSGAILVKAHLDYSDFRRADFRGAVLLEADLSGSNLSEANLSGADLMRTRLVETILTGATLTDCNIYGISAWNVKLEGAIQNNLVITPTYEPTVTVDNLEVAQFIYLLLNNPKIRDVIDTVARKAVLILGRFTPERKMVLDALREALRVQGYVPILFDFDKPASRDLTETVSTLAHLARFIIVDLTHPGSAPHEVATVIPHTVIPVQPLILNGEKEYGMFHDLRRRYHWVLPTYAYINQAHLLATVREQIIEPAERKAQELEKR